MYSEVVSDLDEGVARLREGVDPDNEWLTDENLKKILITCSCMIDRAVVKCLLGIQQKAKIAKKPDVVIHARNLQSRFEAGLIQI